MSAQPETYISVDVETAGPNPGGYSLLSIGACTVLPPLATFYVELQPHNMASTPQALAISGLSLTDLAKSGQPAAQAMQNFAVWLAQVTPPNSHPVFVGLNAPFDWSFVNDYFHRHLGLNPFGHSALDIKALYMGLTGAAWHQTGFAALAGRYHLAPQLTHNALQDALHQAEVFRRILSEVRQTPAPQAPPPQQEPPS